MSATSREIASQPAIWRRAVDLASEATLLRAGARVAVIGCGTSFHVGQVLAVLREERGLGETDAFAASEVPLDRSYDQLLVISRSGTTSEVLTALDQLPAGPETIGIVGVADTPIAHAVDRIVLLDFADEESVVQTRFPTTVLALFRASFGEDLSEAIADGERALAADLPAGAVEATHHVFLGRGAGVGLAFEAALKMRETAQMWSEAYAAMEYRHGPIAVATERSAVWMFGTAPEGLADDCAATGAVVIESDLDPLAQLVQVQRVAVAIATAKGIDPDRPRNLRRSIVLEGGG